MSRKDNNGTADQMMAMAKLLIQSATELKSGQSQENGTGPRKGLTNEQKQLIISRRIRVALKK